MMFKFKDYHGPRVGHAVVDGKLKQLTPAVARRIARTTHKIGFKPPKS